MSLLRIIVISCETNKLAPLAKSQGSLVLATFVLVPELALDQLCAYRPLSASVTG